MEEQRHNFTVNNCASLEAEITDLKSKKKKFDKLQLENLLRLNCFKTQIAPDMLYVKLNMSKCGYYQL